MYRAKAMSGIGQSLGTNIRCTEANKPVLDVKEKTSLSGSDNDVSPLQLIAMASRAALDLAEAGYTEPALNILEQLSINWSLNPKF